MVRTYSKEVNGVLVEVLWSKVGKKHVIMVDGWYSIIVFEKGALGEMFYTVEELIKQGYNFIKEAA